MNNKIAFITGATSGIGATFAKVLASQKYDLVITGRREEKIQAFAAELRSKNNIKVEVIIAELANVKDIDMLVEKITNIKNLEILINNAGFAKKGSRFYEENITVYEDMLKVHALATIKLTQAALPTMVTNNIGSIINVSSIMSFFPCARQSIYVATKAFISLFTESIALELKGTGVRVQALCPGLTFSDLHERIGVDVEKLAKKRVWLWQSPMHSKVVVDKSFKYLAKGKIICVPGFFNKVIITLHYLRRLF